MKCDSLEIISLLYSKVQNQHHSRIYSWKSQKNQNPEMTIFSYKRKNLVLANLLATPMFFMLFYRGVQNNTLNSEKKNLFTEKTKSSTIK